MESLFSQGPLLIDRKKEKDRGRARAEGGGGGGGGEEIHESGTSVA